MQRRPDSLSLPSSLVCDPSDSSFRTFYNLAPFGFSHNLGEHPLFDVSHLVELSRFLQSSGSRDRVLLFQEDARLDQGWERKKPEGADVQACLEDINDSNSWVLMKDVQKHPDYEGLLDRFVLELEELTGTSIRPAITWIDAYIFVSSPGQLTPYHIDHESNFLLQIRGTKHLHICSPGVRSIVSEKEIERYYIGEMSAAKPRHDVEQHAQAFELQPGDGVHHPPLAPHWATTGEEFSISLSLLFFLKDYDSTAKVYQANHVLRTLGLTPTPPGVSHWKDSLKRITMSNLGYQPSMKTEVVRAGLNKYRDPVRFTYKWMRQRLRASESR